MLAFGSGIVADQTFALAPVTGETFGDIRDIEKLRMDIKEQV